MQNIKWIYSGISIFLFFCQAYAATYTVEEHSNLIGEILYHRIQPYETWQSIAYQYDLSQDELKKANKHIPQQTLCAGHRLLIPTKYLLPPKHVRKGIVIHVHEKRLYYFPTQNIVITYPIHIGKNLCKNPSIQGSITEKHTPPTWLLPVDMQNESQQEEQFTNIVKTKFKKLLGNYILRVSDSNTLIHGSADDQNVGINTNFRSIQLYNKDMAELYFITPLNTAFFIRDDNEENEAVHNENLRNIEKRLLEIEKNSYAVEIDDSAIHAMFYDHHNPLNHKNI